MHSVLLRSIRVSLCLFVRSRSLEDPLPSLTLTLTPFNLPLNTHTHTHMHTRESAKLPAGHALQATDTQTDRQTGRQRTKGISSIPHIMCVCVLMIAVGCICLSVFNCTSLAPVELATDISLRKTTRQDNRPVGRSAHLAALLSLSVYASPVAVECPPTWRVQEAARHREEGGRKRRDSRPMCLLCVIPSIHPSIHPCVCVKHAMQESYGATSYTPHTTRIDGRHAGRERESVRLRMGVYQPAALSSETKPSTTAHTS